MEKRKYINTSPEPVSLEGTEKILNQMNRCVCKVYNNGEAIGFFTKIPFNSSLLPVLITNNKVINKKDIANNKTINISLNGDKKSLNIIIDKERKIYTSEELDITIIEIKENQDNLNNEYIELDENIINFFEKNTSKNIQNLGNIYSNKSIYVIDWPKGNDLSVSYGQPPKINNSEIKHKCNVNNESSGSPILLIENQTLIGINSAYKKKDEYNKGKLIVDSIIELHKKYGYNLKIIKEKPIDNYDNDDKNYINAEFDVLDENEEIRIINSYEQYIKNHNWESNKIYENEKEIKENCEIIINKKKIPFCYFYKFPQKGKYQVQYLFKNALTNTNALFYDCKYLVNLDLSNFNARRATHMIFMFSECSSLLNINLSHLNTQYVTNMNGMFSGCSSLTDLDLSYFDTQNITYIGNMFYGCTSLKKLDLSNFNTQKVIYMKDIFTKCTSLKKENVITNDSRIIDEIHN